MPFDVFCDESGFTGENLLNPHQQYFAYASVAIHSGEAAELVAKTVRDFGVQGNELKGRRLVRYNRGRQAIESLVRAIGDRTLLVVHHKEYSLASKFFEYTFEPLISDISSLFYAVNFHRFVSNLLYMNMLLGHERAVRLSRAFEDAVRSDDTSFGDLISLHSSNNRDPVEQLISFCVYNRTSLLRELADVKKHGGWTLELTLSSLWSLLTTWDDRGKSPLRVVCDESAPLKDGREFIDMMVGRTDKVTVRLGRRERSYLFNLAEPITLAKSTESAGVQLADVLAAAACYGMENRHDLWSQSVFRSLLEAGAIHEDCIFPELKHVDLREKEPAINCLVLQELLRRSEYGASLTNQFDLFIEAAHETYAEFRGQYTEFDLSAETALQTFRRQ